MTTKGDESVVSYAPIPPHPGHQNYVVLSRFHRRHPALNRHHSLHRCLGVSAVVVLLATAACLLYPSDPDLTLVRLRLNHIQILTSPHVSLNLSLSLTLRICNVDFFSLNYSSLVVSVDYRGEELGFLKSNGGHIRARGSSYVNATLVVDGFEVIHDVVYLVEDLARGSIPFDTHSEVKGTLGLFFIDLPIKARMLCEVLVNTNNQTIIPQDCYPE